MADQSSSGAGAGVSSGVSSGGMFSGILRSVSSGPSYGRAATDPILVTSPFRATPSTVHGPSAGHGSGAPATLDQALSRLPLVNRIEDDQRRSASPMERGGRTTTSPSRVRAASPYGRVGSPNAQAAQAPAPAAVLVRVAAPIAPQQARSPADHPAIGTRLLRAENHIGVVERDLRQRADTADAAVTALTTRVWHLEQTI